jgi:hypothetical protein
MLHWRKTSPKSWGVLWGETLLGYVRREYAIRRGRRLYRVGNTDGQWSAAEWHHLADAARHLALMCSVKVLAVQD